MRKFQKDAASKKKEPQTIRAVVLVPLTYNDGNTVAAHLRNSILDEIFVAFDGYTIEGTVKGAYKMKETGEKCIEALEKVVIVLSDDRVPLLRQMVGRWCSTLRQEVMYLEVTHSTIEFVPPRTAEDKP